jgi:hypothetical protein
MGEKIMKVLILTASPKRDNIIDFLIAEKLTSMGHVVKTAPMLREGRQAVLDFQPNVCVVPPIRNVYARDFTAQLKKWSVGVVTRHTEPSCDWQDFHAMSPKQQQGILGAYPYVVDAELVWSEDEAQILNKRGRVQFSAYPIGAVACDAYFRKDLIAKHRNKKRFNKQYKFNPKKKTLLIASPWGFIDTAPDLSIDELGLAKKDIEGRDRHFKMIRHLVKVLKNWNILITTHPGVVEAPYQELCTELKVPLDTSSAAYLLLNNVDALVHAGSIMAINAHLLKIPAFQYGDVNVKGSESWWGGKSAMSQVSPFQTKPGGLACVIASTAKRSNANKEAIANLEKGRFGAIDGKATDRAAEIINKVKGEFKMIWPKSPNDYSQLTIVQSPEKVCVPTNCSICGEVFGQVDPRWMEMVKAEAMNQIKAQTDVEIKLDFSPKRDLHCANCGARFYRGSR